MKSTLNNVRKLNEITWNLPEGETAWTGYMNTLMVGEKVSVFFLEEKPPKDLLLCIRATSPAILWM